jgi:hypothetical protein
LPASRTFPTSGRWLRPYADPNHEDPCEGHDEDFEQAGSWFLFDPLNRDQVDVVFEWIGRESEETMT